LIAGSNRSRECERCHYTTALPKDTPEVDVLKMRVAFLESVSTDTIETLRGVIENKDKEIADLKTK
jgi:hypothetical protein